MSRILTASTVIACSLLSATAAKADQIGSYAGGSIGFDRSDSDSSQIAADGVFSISENFQARATVGDGFISVAPTYSRSVGQWRFAAGPALQVVRTEIETETVNFINDDGEEDSFDRTTGGDNETRLAGIALAERAIGEYGDVFAGVSFSNELSGSIGVGLRF